MKTEHSPKEIGMPGRKLTANQIYNLIQNHQQTILPAFEYDLTDFIEFDKHCLLVEKLAEHYLKREYRSFCIDENNKQILRFLVYYFNNCKLAEDIFPNEGYKIHKNILLIGEPGTGKSLLMQIFADYLKLTRNPNRFENLSVTQMMNYYKIHGHIDYYTYNENGYRNSLEGVPEHLCLNDVGLETENQKSYGTKLDSVIDEFLYARYEIYQSRYKKYHITSNLDINKFRKRFGDRLVDRFKSFNVISVLGPSRRI